MQEHEHAWGQVATDTYTVRTRTALEQAYSNWVQEVHDELPFDDCVLVAPDNAKYPMTVRFVRPEEDGPDEARWVDQDEIYALWTQAGRS